MAIRLPDDCRISLSIATFAGEIRKLPNVAAMNITHAFVEINITLRGRQVRESFDLRFLMQSAAGS